MIFLRSLPKRLHMAAVNPHPDACQIVGSCKTSSDTQPFQLATAITFHSRKDSLFLFALVCFKGSLSLLDIFSFFHGLNQMVVVQSRRSRRRVLAGLQRRVQTSGLCRGAVRFCFSFFFCLFPVCFVLFLKCFHFSLRVR